MRICYLKSNNGFYFFFLGYENISIVVYVLESKKLEEVIQEEWNCSKEKLFCILEDKYVSKYYILLIKIEGFLEKVVEDIILQSLDFSVKLCEWKGEVEENDGLVINCYYLENFKG